MITLLDNEFLILYKSILVRKQVDRDFKDFIIDKLVLGSGPSYISRPSSILVYIYLHVFTTSSNH